MPLINLILKSFYFMLPVYFANMIPVFLAKIPWLKKFDTPMDFGRKFGKQRMLGSHKTWRGFIGAIFAAILIVYLQRLLFEFNLFNSVSIYNYAGANLLLFGFLLGFGAMLGDAVKSFFKRRLGIKSGQSWPVFDQLDYVIGALLIVSMVFVPNWDVIITILIITPILNILANIIGYMLKLKKVWW
jgi:CDP-2,3-bis-(O-geranylgeranyl)-sn-glycerol synthase